MTSSLIFSLKVQAFRSFQEEARLDICPLTLLYGFNQAGKSSLLRLLVLLADSLQPGAGPLDLQCPALRGATFKELGWLGTNPALSPWITLVAPEVTTEPTLKIQFADADGLVVNRLHLVPGAGDKFLVDLDGAVVRDGNGIEAQYAGRYRGQDWSGRLKFVSLFPDGLPQQAKELAAQVRKALDPLQRIQWLHANRTGEGTDETRRARCCRASGADLPLVLSASPEEQTVLEATSRWLSQQDGMGNEIALRRMSSGQRQLVHRASGREELPLHLAGEGLRALLPILLSATWAETKSPTAPSLLALEEPEAYLHPTLQVALFDRLLETVRAGIPVVLETHSVYLLRAMQLAVLDGRLQSGQVALHWVEQRANGAGSVTRVDVKSDATLTGWRPDLFEKEQELAHRILDLRWKKAGGG